MKRLSGMRTKSAPIERSGTRYVDCPVWVPDAVERCIASGLISRPTEIVWHLRQTSTRWGTCWPAEGRIHIYPWAGQREDIDDSFEVDVSGEVRSRKISARVVPGAQENSDLEDTLAHELAHLAFREHGPLHAALTKKLLVLVRRR